MISKAVKIVALAGVALLAFVAQANASDRLTVTRNGTLRVPLSASAGSVIVANPDIADVNVVDSHTIYVIGRGYGSSAVTVLDRMGHPIFDGQILVTPGQHNAVMMYKGSAASVLDCSSVCQPAEGETQASGHSAAAAAPQPGTTTTFIASRTETTPQ